MANSRRIYLECSGQYLPILPMLVLALVFLGFLLGINISKVAVIWWRRTAFAS